MEDPFNISVKKFDLSQLLAMGDNPLHNIVKDFGVVYITAITRDGCSGCEEQKPMFQKLAERMRDRNPGKTEFSDIHIRHAEGEVHESEQAKAALRHGSYPTYLVHVKSRLGPLEHYRAAYPSMEELEKHVLDAFELAEFYQKDAAKQVAV